MLQVGGFGVRPGRIFVRRGSVAGGARLLFAMALGGCRPQALAQLHALGPSAVAGALGPVAILLRRSADHLDDPKFAAHHGARLQRRKRIFDLGRGRLRQTLAAAVAEFGVVGSRLAALGARNHRS